MLYKMHRLETLWASAYSILQVLEIVMINAHEKLWALGLELEEGIPYLSLVVNIWANDVLSLSKDILLYKMEMMLRTQNGEKVNVCKRLVNLKAVFPLIPSVSQHYTSTLDSC